MINDLIYGAFEISKIINGTLVGKNCLVNSISLDSREIGENVCFFAIKGEKFDGHNYVNEAVKNGAKLIVAQKKINASVSVIYVDDVIKALGLLGKHHKGHTKVIAVTGSVGKTTVKNMIMSVLRQQYSVCGTEKNYNNEIGVPLTLLGIKSEDYCVIEMGMRGLGQIDWLAYLCQPEIVVVTNCTDAHLEKLKTRDNIFKAKMEILNYEPKYAVMPFEDRFLNYDYKTTNVTFLGKNGDNWVESIEEGDGFLKVTLTTGQEYTLNTLLSCNANNSLIAYTIGKYLDISNKKIFEGLSKYEKEENREEIIKLGQTTIINDCYNASFQSMKEAILSAKRYSKICNKRLYVLLGDMLELGDESEELHVKIGRICRDSGVDKVFLYGNLVKFIQIGFESGEIIDDSDENVKNIAKQIEGGVLLVKASRRLNLEKFVYKLKEKLDE